MGLNYVFRDLGYENGEKYHEPRALNAPTANGRTIRRQYRNFYRANDDWSFLFNAVRSFQFALLSHHVLAGLEQYNQNQTYRFATAREREAGGTVPSLDLYQPNYGAANPATYTLSAFNTYTAQHAPHRLLRPGRGGPQPLRASTGFRSSGPLPRLWICRRDLGV